MFYNNLITPPQTKDEEADSIHKNDETFQGSIEYIMP